jgi:hypothetical protein
MDDLVANSAGAVTGDNGSYTVGETVTLLAGDILQVRPGENIRFSSSTSLQVNGNLTVSGATDQKVTFTSNSATPAAGDWIAINPRKIFTNGSPAM